MPFAQATRSGSFYAFCRIDLATLPIVAFGDEGGQHVVARNLPELFQRAAFDSEVMADEDEAYHYRDPDDDHTPSHEAFVARMRTHFPRDPDSVVATARSEHGERWATWSAARL